MSQNRSAAVMQQRHEALDSLDDFPTPPWATRALCEQLVARGHPLHLQHVWEPACNRMHMVRPLGEYFDRVHATDVHDYGDPRQDGVIDFLIDWGADAPDVDWVITTRRSASPPTSSGMPFASPEWASRSSSVRPLSRGRDVTSSSFAIGRRLS